MEETAMSDRDDVLFFAGLVLGAIAGGAVAALLTPQSGSEIREQVAERGLELKNRADDAVQRAQQVAAEAVAKVQATAQDLIKKPGDDLVNGGGI
jgi:gas vesicle protein